MTAAELPMASAYARAPVTGASSPAVVTAFRLLDLLIQRPSGARLADLARDLSLPKSSALRILATMCQIGVVRRDESTGNYQPGTRLLDYAKAPLNFDMDLVREFYRVAEPMHAELNETIQLAVLSATDVMFIARIDSTKVVRLVTQIGRRLPAHATAVGKAILAFSDAADVDRIIAAGLPRLTANTITDPVALRAELDQATAERLCHRVGGVVAQPVLPVRAGVRTRRRSARRDHSLRPGEPPHARSVSVASRSGPQLRPCPQRHAVRGGPLAADHCQPLPRRCRHGNRRRAP